MRNNHMRGDLESTVGLDQAMAQKLRDTELLAGYGPAPSLFGLGFLSGILIGLTPGIWLLVNSFFRFLSNRHRPYQQFQNPSATSFVSTIPDILLIGIFGGVLALARRLSIQKNRFWILNTNRGALRLGLDDLVGLVVGWPLVWFMFYRHEFGTLFLLTGVFLPLLGLALAWLWGLAYPMFVRKFITVPLDTQIEVTVKQTLELHPDTSELFRIEKVTVNRDNRQLTIAGAPAEAFFRDKNEQRFREVVRNIPIVTQNITAVEIRY